MSDETEKLKRPKHRSPSYPAFNLEKTLERAKQLEAAAGRHPAPISAALDAWGYSPKSSNGLLTIASLKKFGLAADQAKLEARKLRLTQLGYELVFYDTNRDSPEWKERARIAAFTPTIHRELWQKYNGELPADGIIRPYLVLERGFSESAADEVLREFRATLAFAQIGPGEPAGILSEPKPDENANEIMTPPAIEVSTGDNVSEGETVKIARKPQARTIQVPYSPGEWALIQAQFPMSESAWTQMLAVLQAMKPGLVGED